MQQASVAVTQRRQEALQRAEERHPGFGRLYNSAEITDRYRRERPRSAGWIGIAEAQGTAEDIDEFYDSFYNEASQYESSEQPSTPNSVKPTVGGPFSLQAINRLPLEKRRQVIAALGDRVGDTPLDEADTSEEGKRTLR